MKIILIRGKAKTKLTKNTTNSDKKTAKKEKKICIIFKFIGHVSGTINSQSHSLTTLNHLISIN